MRDHRTDERIQRLASKEHWEIPSAWNRRMEELLEGLPDDAAHEGETASISHGEKNRVKRLPGRRMVLAAAALAALLGVTAAASELFDWSPQAVKSFQEPTKEEQDRMTMEGLAVGQTVSATDQGITVTARQIVQDANCLYILLDIQSEEKIIDGNGGFSNETEDGGIFVLETEDPDAFNNSSWAFAPDTPSFGELSDHGNYEIFAMKTPGRDWKEESVTVHFKAYSYYTYENGDTAPHTIQGDWKLELPLGSQSFMAARTFEPEKPVEIKGIPLQVKRVELSPLSMVMVYDMDDYERMWEALYPDQEEGSILELLLSGFDTKDGGEISCGMGGMTGAYDEEAREITQRITLSRYVDVEQVSAVLLGDEKVPVELE